MADNETGGIKRLFTAGNLIVFCLRAGFLIILSGLIMGVWFIVKLDDLVSGSFSVISPIFAYLLFLKLIWPFLESDEKESIKVLLYCWSIYLCATIGVLMIPAGAFAFIFIIKKYECSEYGIKMGLLPVVIAIVASFISFKLAAFLNKKEMAIVQQLRDKGIY